MRGGSRRSADGTTRASALMRSRIRVPPSMAARSVLAVCMVAACLSACGRRHYRDWSGDAVVFGRMRVVAADGRELTASCSRQVSSTDDYVPGRPYSYRGQGRERFVVRERFDADGSYFQAAAPGLTIPLYLECAQVLESSLTRATVNGFRIDIGRFVAPPQRAASYLGNLVLRLESEGRLVFSPDGGGGARPEEAAIPEAARQLPLVTIPLTSITGPARWSGSTHSEMRKLLP